MLFDHKYVMRFIYAFLLLFIFFDFAYSGLQYSRATLDGDIMESVVPAPSMYELMDDPFGVETIAEKNYHHSPNRFFAHWIFQKAFRGLPIALQTIFDPVESVYAACAVSKLFMHIMLIILIYIAITGRVNFFRKDFLIVAAVLTPLFQANGFVRKIGIIDPSITYSFFYALPAIYIIIYFLPLILEFYHGKKLKLNWFTGVVWILLAVLACFSGALNPAIALIVTLMLISTCLYQNWKKNPDESIGKRIILSIKQIPKKYYFYLVPISLISLYVLYLGTFSNTAVEMTGDKTTWDLYKLLPRGFYDCFISFPWLLLSGIVLINYTLIGMKFKNTAESKPLFNALIWVLVFSTIYVLLLPLGGYRIHRPFIIRYDTILPITLMFFFLIGSSTLFLVKQLSGKFRIYHIAFMVIILLMFSFADRSRGRFNECEKASLEFIAESKEDVIPLTNNCSVVSWGPFYTPEECWDRGKLLYIWRITDKPKVFYNMPEYKE